MQPAQLFDNAEEFDVFVEKFLRRYAFVNHKNMHAFAEAFALYIKATEVPRDPFLLLPMLGITLQRDSLSRASRAVWVRTANGYFIHYSQYESRASVRFSLWHEIFEILCHHPGFPSVFNPYWKERLADRFSAAVLMPEWAIREEMQRFATNAEAMPYILSDRFGVSLSAMRRRMREVNNLDNPLQAIACLT